MKTMTFRMVESSKACENFGATHTTRIETVREDGVVEFHVYGTGEHGYFNEKGEFTADVAAMPIDFDRVRKARIAMGYRVVK